MTMKQKIQVAIAFVVAIPAILVMIHFFAYALFDMNFLPASTTNAEAIGFARIFTAGISLISSLTTLLFSGIFDGKQR